MILHSFIDIWSKTEEITKEKQSDCISTSIRSLKCSRISSTFLTASCGLEFFICASIHHSWTSFFPTPKVLHILVNITLQICGCFDLCPGGCSAIGIETGDSWSVTVLCVRQEPPQKEKHIWDKKGHGDWEVCFTSGKCTLKTIPYLCNCQRLSFSPEEPETPGSSTAYGDGDLFSLTRHLTSTLVITLKLPVQKMNFPEKLPSCCCAKSNENLLNRQTEWELAVSLVLKLMESCSG